MALTKVPGDMVGTGGIVQVVNYQTGAVATGTTTMPWDDTIPQNTEGIEFLTLAITPTSASNILIIEAIVVLANSAAPSTMSVALFQDSTANALAAVAETFRDVNDPATIPLRHKMTAGTTSATTFKVRAGFGAAGTTTLNGQGGGRRFGGVAASSITITEIAV